MTTQFLNIIPHYKELKLLREMAESRSEAERVQGKPAMFGCASKQESVQRLLGTYQTDKRPRMKGLPLFKFETI